jgi:hypothetical protein
VVDVMEHPLAAFVLDDPRCLIGGSLRPPQTRPIAEETGWQGGRRKTTS